MSKKLAAIIDVERRDTSERVKSLSLQAMAWRQIAVIGTHDPEYAKSKIGWLMFVSVPFVDEIALGAFIEEHRSMAEEYGKLSGVFA